jgi:amidohydrolase
MVNKSRVHALAAQYSSEVQSIRRHLHKHPELSFEEHKTAAFVADQLTAMGVSFKSGIGGLGLVAELQGQEPATGLIALRADMDALPIHERNNVDYISQNPGVMHACGHDAHTACALGAVRILHELRDEWKGRIRVLFQPAEERIPGGASLMIRDGALDPRPQSMLGQHVYPELPAGKVGFKPGIYMASADELYFTVKGKGGHAALPQRLHDPVIAAAQLIINLQQVVSRNAPPEIPTVLSMGKIIADGATNIVPNEVYMEGTFRTFDEAWRSRAHEIIARICSATGDTFGVEVQVEIRKGYPFLVNDEVVTARAKAAAIDFLGEDQVVDLGIRPTAEDFAYYSQLVPSCFYRLGTASPDGRFTSGLHTPTFDIDETALTTGAGLMAWLALEESLNL